MVRVKLDRTTVSDCTTVEPISISPLIPCCSFRQGCDNYLWRVRGRNAIRISSLRRHSLPEEERSLLRVCVCSRKKVPFPLLPAHPRRKFAEKMFLERLNFPRTGTSPLCWMAPTRSNRTNVHGIRMQTFHLTQLSAGER